MTKSVSTIKCKRHRTSYITFKNETSRHDFCAKHVAKYIVIMETLNRIVMIFMAGRNEILLWKRSLSLTILRF